MTEWRLLARNLQYFRAANAAAAAGVAVATGVLTGALLVGDSVRGSLKDLVEQRLGRVDHAVTAQRYFPASLADRLSKARGFSDSFSACVTGVIVRGSAANETETARAAGVQVAALGGDWMPVEAGRCVINGVLADALAVDTGDTILINVPRRSNLSQDVVFARRRRSSRVSMLRLAVADIRRQRGFVADFSLLSTQRPAPRAWMNLPELQEAVGQVGRANTLLLSGVEHGTSGNAELRTMLSSVATLADYGMKIDGVGGGEIALLSRGMYIPLAVESAVPPARSARGVLAHLANTVATVPSGGGPGGGKVHYAMVAGVNDPPGGALAADEIAVNQWLADRLGAQVGDRITLTYYLRRPDGATAEIRSDAPDVGMTFRVARVLPMAGMGADPTLSPTYEGLTDTASIADWNPPAGLKIDKDLITDADESYWRRYKAAPKLLLNLSTAQRLWGGSFGRLTSMRFDGAVGDRLRRDLLGGLDPAAVGFALRPVRAEQLAAAEQGTDFAGLFTGMSSFLIASAGLLTALLLRLGIEQRARQLGLLAALGHRPRTLRRLALAEGMIVSVIGGVVGAAAGVGYTAALMAGLRTWWADAVGTTGLRLHVAAATLGIGLVAGMFVALGAAVWGLWHVGRAPAARLLVGQWAATPRAPGRLGIAGLILAWMTTVLAAGLLAATSAGWLAMQWGYLLGGAALLASSLFWLNRLLRPARSRSRRLGESAGILRLAAVNVGRNHTRSLLVIGVLACATFILATVAAFRRGAPTDTHHRASGAGGFALLARADIPLPAELGTSAGRRLAALDAGDDGIWRGSKFLSLRRWAGEDASCLNITRPRRPTLLAVPGRGAFAGRFTFARTLATTADPWALLQSGDDEAAIPVIADDDAARYVLRLDLGDSVVVTDDHGRPRRLRLVATLRDSIFQGELLMDEDHFRRLFPSESGFGLVLVEADAAELERLQRVLSVQLADYGLVVERTADLLKRFREVANTYLSTFQVLGALGLMLGSAGLAVLLLRNVLDRRAELALLTALGFGTGRRLAMLLAEHAALLLAGLLVGLLGGLGAMVSAHQASRAVDWLGLATALAGVAGVGLIVLATTVWLVGRRFQPAELRRE